MMSFFSRIFAFFIRFYLDSKFKEVKKNEVPHSRSMDTISIRCLKRYWNGSAGNF